MVKKFVLFSLLCCCIAAAFFGCVNDALTPPPQELKFGDSTITNVITVPTGGGRFFFNTGDTTNSARIIFAPNSYLNSKIITLTTTKITGSSFGDNVTPISSLYTIDGGTDFSNKDIIIDIPIPLDPNNFSMAFLYDKVTHELEGVPAIGFITPFKSIQFSIVLRRSGSLFISTIAKTKLSGNASSSFDPKQDNWEFPNFGTMITPNGQFAGQSLSALWYYYEQELKGSPHLYGTFDIDHGGESPKIWQDNDLGFRVAAETQQALKWNTNAFDMMAPLDNGNIVLTLYQVVYSMMVTGKPQLITVIKDSTVLPLIVYKVVGGLFYVSDPNFPAGVNQSMRALSNLPSFYNTAVSMKDLLGIGASKYINATYIGVRALIDWDAIKKIWTDAAKNVYASFPPYNINFTDALGNLVPSANGFVTLFDTVNLNISGTQPSDIRIYQNNVFSVYTTSNILSLKPGSNHISVYSLNQTADGSNTLWSGFSSFNIQKQTFAITPSLDSTFVESDVVLHTLMGQKSSQSLRYEWDMGDGSPVIKNTDIDIIKYRYKKIGSFTVSLSIFQVSTNALVGKEISTVVVSLNPVLISPTGINGIANVSYVFFGIVNLPKDIVQRCEWTMGDGSATKSIIGADTIHFAFQNVGTFTIKLNIFDNETNALLGSTQAPITIINMQLPTIAQLQSMKFVTVLFHAKMRYSSEQIDHSQSQHDQISAISISQGASTDTSSQRIKWNGLRFTTSYSISTSDSSNTFTWNRYTEGKSVTGNFYSDLSQISVSASDGNSGSYSNNQQYGNSSSNTQLGCTGAILAKVTSDSIVYAMSGPSLSYISNISNGTQDHTQVQLGHMYETYNNYNFTYWFDTTTIPTFFVILYR